MVLPDLLVKSEQLYIYAHCDDSYMLQYGNSVVTRTMSGYFLVVKMYGKCNTLCVHDAYARMISLV